MTSPSSRPASSSSIPETARTRSTTDPSRRRSRNRSARSTSERRSACQRPRTRISGSLAAASSASSSSVSVVSPIASFQSNRASASVVSRPLECRAAVLVAVRLTRRRLVELTQFRGSSTGTPSSSRRGIAVRSTNRTSSSLSSMRRRLDRVEGEAALRRARARSARAGGAPRAGGRPSGGTRTPRRRRREGGTWAAPASDRRPPAATARGRRRTGRRSRSSVRSSSRRLSSHGALERRSRPRSTQSVSRRSSAPRPGVRRQLRLGRGEAVEEELRRARTVPQRAGCRAARRLR